MTSKIYTPQNTADKLMGETQYKRTIENAIMNTFIKSGFFEIQTPVFEYLDLFSSQNVSINETDIFKIVDTDGKILALRPDMTTPIARVVGTKLGSKEKLPIRLSYCGSVFRSMKNKQKEFTQSGIELVGVHSAMADAEVVMNTIEALKAVGLSEFQIEIGQSEFIKGILTSLSLSEEDELALTELIDHKDLLGLNRFLKEQNIAEDKKAILEKLPSLFGDINLMEQIDTSALNDISKNAIENLQTVCSILSSYGYEQYISIDLAMVQSINYYTGVIFRVFTRGVGFAIASGGRYDNLIGKFGENMSATGSAIDIDMLMAALYRQQNEIADPCVDLLVYLQNVSQNKNGILMIKALRETAGLSVEMYINDSQYENAVSYAKDKNISRILDIDEEANMILHDLLTDKKTEISLEKFCGEER